MLSSDFKKQYLRTLANCDNSLFRHPQRTMTERLQSLLPLAAQYSEADCYGQGELVNEFEQQVAAMLGHEAALFLPSGTMAQTMALRIWAEKKHCNQVAFHPTSHLQLHEQNAYQVLHGLDSCLVGKLNEVINRADLDTIHIPLAALLLELPMREIGGQLPTWKELEAQQKWAKSQGIALHLDGARLWSCSEYYQKTLAEIGSLFDSVYVSFYKDLDGIAGAMLTGSAEFIDEARIWTRRLGGNLITLFPDILAAKQGLTDNIPLMPDFVAKAATIAKLFNQHFPTHTIPLCPPCNLFHLVIEQSAKELMPKVMKWSEQYNMALLPLPRTQTDTSCRFEISIGQNALKVSNHDWQKAIASFAHDIILD
ncbi:threonine aldolase family protein [Colwellia sp. 12G3]|uniref:threonine aldolase family protein n=1 Tax=Colwellia sp. 12G3 TaxID=2058299 RepID=UPI000C324DAD|nr:beta-eliminating lyase-related protein [Colwellia sp. 12G3]PKI17594.1 threonine aldolase [Colwellia sp. 12G3]